MAFPSTVTAFTNPNPGDQLNSPSHSSIETAQNTGLTELMTFLGTESSTAGTLFYDIRAAASNGGGHVQTANKGGTGQTSYTKGDMLVAANSSTLSKLAVGTNNQFLIADDTQAAGVKWGSPNKIGTNASVVTIIADATETSIMSVIVPASVLSNNNAVRGRVFISNFTAGASETLLLKANYGANQLASVLVSPSSSFTASVAGFIDYILIGNATTSAQRGEVAVNIITNRLNPLASSTLGINAFQGGTSSVSSNSNQTFGLTAKFGTGATGSRLDVDGYVVEKIL